MLNHLNYAFLPLSKEELAPIWKTYWGKHPNGKLDYVVPAQGGCFIVRRLNHSGSSFLHHLRKAVGSQESQSIEDFCRLPEVNAALVSLPA